MKHKKYDHLPTKDRYLLIESSGTINKKKIYRSKENDLVNIKNEIFEYQYSKATHYFNNVLIRKHNNNIIAYIYMTLKKLGKIKMDYYEHMNEAIQQINNTKYNSLYITPSIYWNFKDIINLKHYEHICLGGEQLTDKIKEYLLNSTNANVYDTYGGNDYGLIGIRDIRKEKYHRAVGDMKIIKNKDNRMEFIKKNSGACDFIEDQNGLQDLRKNETFICADFIKYIDEKKFIYLGRDNSFVKINGKRIDFEQIKSFLIEKLKITDIKFLSYKDEQELDQFCAYVITDKKIDINIIKKIIIEEYSDIVYMPKKILIDKAYFTKDINSGSVIKTDIKKLLQLVLENGTRTY